MTTASPKRGAFISFEGGDGVGKSTQIALLAERLRKAGREVVVTREPGGSVGAEAIRALLVTGAADRWSPLTEALLMYAARADHLEKIINPARMRGAVVLSDRFSDSSMAYQGIAGALGERAIGALESLVVGADGPQLTLILDAPVSATIARAHARGGDHRFEAKGAAYQDRVRQAFLRIARDSAERCAIVDASRPVDQVAADIASLVSARLNLFEDA
ncbi:MAG: dTMP kinase [Parvularculaceae bacterium]